MTTRRTFIQGVAALPAVAVPVMLPDTLGAQASPDAALIEAARRTCLLAALEERAIQRRAEAEERFERLEPVCPADCRQEISATHKAIMDECPTPMTLADNLIMADCMRRAGLAEQAVRERHAAEMVVYQAEYDRLIQETGLAKAERAAEWLTDRLQAAVEHLANVPSETKAGLVAKADVWKAVSKGAWGGCNVPWLDYLAYCVVREVGTIGGAA